MVEQFKLTGRKIIKVGNTYGIILPKALVESTDLFRDKEFDVTFNFPKNEIKESKQVSLKDSESEKERLMYAWDPRPWNLCEVF